MRFRSPITLIPSNLLPLRGLRRTSLLIVLLIAGCAPAASEPVQPETSVLPAEPVTEEQQALPTPTATLAPVIATEPVMTEAPTIEPQVVVTSRGPNLEATDPSTVSLASGELQLVEFFRFT